MINNANELPTELRNQLAVIDQSQCYLLMIMASLVLSYYTINIQRQQLICTAKDPALCKCLPETLPLQTTSSIMIIIALLFFFNLSGNTLIQSRTPKECQLNQCNHLASTMVLVAALIRFCLLIQRGRISEESAL